VHILYTGYVQQEISFTQSQNQFNLSSILDLITTKLPKLRYQNACNHVFGDVNCGIDLSTDADTDAEDITQAGTVWEATYRTVEAAVFHDAAEEQKFRFGHIIFTSGRLSGMEFPIHAQANVSGEARGIVTLAYAMPLLPAEDDTFNAVQGCPKSGLACDARFDNYENFFGFEYIPQHTLKRQGGKRL